MRNILITLSLVSINLSITAASYPTNTSIYEENQEIEQTYSNQNLLGVTGAGATYVGAWEHPGMGGLSDDDFTSNGGITIGGNYHELFSIPTGAALNDWVYIASQDNDANDATGTNGYFQIKQGTGAYSSYWYIDIGNDNSLGTSEDLLENAVPINGSLFCFSIFSLLYGIYLINRKRKKLTI